MPEAASTRRRPRRPSALCSAPGVSSPGVARAHVSARLTGALWCAALLLGGCTFWKRAFTYPAGDPVMDVGWYRPLEAVPGRPCARPLPRARPGRTGLPRAALRQASAYARRMRACALLVVHRGRVVWERYWCGAGPETRPNTMSMSKTVVALLLGALRGEGRLGPPETPVSTYLPEWSRDARRKITLAHLMQMTSGLRNRDSVMPWSDLARMHLGTDARRLALSVPASRPPGEVFEYNNVNTQVLSVMMERITGQRWAELLSERLWKPLGASEARVWLDRVGGTAKTYCCLFATARDWARVGLLILRRGRVGSSQVIPASWIRRMLTPSPREANYGYGLWLGHTRGPCCRRSWREPFVAPDTAILMGQAEQRVYVVPSRELVIVRLGREAGSRWDDTVIPNILIRALARAEHGRPPTPPGRLRPGAAHRGSLAKAP